MRFLSCSMDIISVAVSPTRKYSFRDSRYPFLDLLEVGKIIWREILNPIDPARTWLQTFHLYVQQSWWQTGFFWFYYLTSSSNQFLATHSSYDLPCIICWPWVTSSNVNFLLWMCSMHCMDPNNDSGIDSINPPLLKYWWALHDNSYIFIVSLHWVSTARMHTLHIVPVFKSGGHSFAYFPAMHHI